MQLIGAVRQTSPSISYFGVDPFLWNQQWTPLGESSIAVKLEYTAFIWRYYQTNRFTPQKACSQLDMHKYQQRLMDYDVLFFYFLPAEGSVNWFWNSLIKDVSQDLMNIFKTSHNQESLFWKYLSYSWKHKFWHTYKFTIRAHKPCSISAIYDAMIIA